MSMQAAQAKWSYEIKTVAVELASSILNHDAICM